MNTAQVNSEQSQSALLLSIKPRYADAIFRGEKTFELRRVRPRVEPGALVLVYVTAPRCALEGAFEVKAVYAEGPGELWERVGAKTGVTGKEFNDYFFGVEIGYAIEIARAWTLEDRISLNTMRGFQIRPPQSYQYLDGQQLGMLL